MLQIQEDNRQICYYLNEVAVNIFWRAIGLASLVYVNGLFDSLSFVLELIPSLEGPTLFLRRIY